MGDSPPERCGYTHSPEREVGKDQKRQSCCYRESLPDTDRCAWHASPSQTNHKTIQNLKAARTPADICSQTRPISELLDGAVLVDMELRDALSFEDASLTGADLTGANLRGADLAEADLRRADMTETNLREADLTGAKLIRGNLTEANLSGADLAKTNLIGSTLTGAKLYSADLSGANLSGANLTEAFLFESDLDHAKLKQSNLTGASLVAGSLSGADLSEANLSGADLNGADLTGADLPEANLSEAKLSADLTRANLQDADLTEANLPGAELCDADFLRATLRGTILPGGEILRKADFTEADLQNQDFRGENLSGASLVKANLTGSELSRANLSKANLERAVLNRADLFDTRLAGAHLEGTVMGNAQTNKGTFERLAPKSAETDSQPSFGERLRTFVLGPTGNDGYRCVYDPTSRFDLDQAGVEDTVANDNEGPAEKAENHSEEDLEDDPEVRAGGVYRQFERLAGENALPEWQRRFFILRQDMQIRQKTGLEYAFAVVQRVLFGFGESFGRVVGWSGAIIATFAAIYLAGGWIRPVGAGGRLGRPVSWTQLPGDPSVLWESLYYSTLTFTALGFGDFRPVGTLGQLLTVLETASGALLLALLVFVLGRRAAR